ncbi:pre-mRNA-splicing factor SYF2 [Dispira parvispora]|uniref:Pre-mRNA-splicing factor SYF2 n=1 Tax=Dispira parvispora TaxID=1520584 RepID=A0A9W8AH88_9FUNG|nr:pre-mRNA-splicing factor SYF2 [Dispira parvispora]
MKSTTTATPSAPLVSTGTSPSSDSPPSPTLSPTPALPDHASEALQTRTARLEALRKRLIKSTQANRREIYAEHQRAHADPRDQGRRDRAKRRADILLAREQAREQGKDYERKRFWEYSVEDVETWEAKQDAKLARVEGAKFASHDQWAGKKYHKLTDQMKPDLVAYHEAKAHQQVEATGSETVAPIQHKPSRKAEDKLVHQVQKNIERRETLSREKRSGDDVTYINDKNKRFNKRISQAYDKYTQEIRDSFERGTAL